jgi:predicted transcriptional regulator
MQRSFSKNQNLLYKTNSLIRIISNDAQGLALYAMDNKKKYTIEELKDRIFKLYGREFPTEDLPTYLNNLKEIGAVESEIENNKTYYLKTDIGKYYGDPIVARAIYVVSNLKRSLRGILRIGSLEASKNNSLYPAYLVIKLLAENPDREFKYDEVSNKLKLDRNTVNKVLEYLRIDKKRGIVYKLKKKLDDNAVEEINKKINSLGLSSVTRSELQEVVKYIKENPKNNFKVEDLKIVIGTDKDKSIIYIDKEKLHMCLSILSEWGYLSSPVEVYTVKANEKVKLLWNELFSHIEKVAISEKPNDKEFRKILEYYRTHPKEWRIDNMTTLRTYNKERERDTKNYAGRDLKSIIKNLFY